MYLPIYFIQYIVLNFFFCYSFILEPLQTLLKSILKSQARKEPQVSQLTFGWKAT